MRFSEQEAKAVSKLLKSLGNKKALLIMEALAHKLTPADIAEQLSMKRSTVQTYLARLTEAALISGRRDRYRLTPLGEVALRWVLRSILPHADEYLRLVRVGNDLRSFEMFPKGLVSRLSLNREDDVVRGVEILKDLDNEWTTLMLKVARAFE